LQSQSFGIIKIESQPMKTTILGLRTTIYQVSDIEKAKEWYTKIFKTEPYFDEPFYVGFNIGGYELGLQPEEKTLSRSEAVVSYWGVANMNDEYKHFIENGAKTIEPPQNVGGEIIAVTVKDPWNNIIGLIYNPEFKLD
jgi:predicted enzyme related to lactoylglutathione lyase